MSEPIITHKIISDFADEKINLKRDDVTEYRAQVNRLRDNLKTYIDEHPDYNLLRMYHSGSVAKGTALKTLNDMDVVVYIKKASSNPSDSKLLSWLQEQLTTAYNGKGITADQITLSTHCVTIHFNGTGLDVDVSPAISEMGDDYAYLIKKHSGERVLTNIPLHLKFIRARKAKQPHHYRQVIRLIKWWVRNIKRDDPNFRFKSFMTELLCAHLADSGLVMNNYVTALEKFFVYIIRTGLKDTIYFTDNYSKDKLPVSYDPIKIYDPVNPNNNVVANYTDADRLKIVNAAQDALDAIHEAMFATTKERAVNCWRKILGPTFNF